MENSTNTHRVRSLQQRIRKIFKPKLIITSENSNYYVFSFTFNHPNHQIVLYDLGKAISGLNNCCRPRGAVSVNEDGNILVRIEYPKGDDKLHAVDLKRDFQILASVIEGMALPIIVGADDHRKVNIVDLAKIGGLLIGGSQADKSELLSSIVISVRKFREKDCPCCMIIDPNRSLHPSYEKIETYYSVDYAHTNSEIEKILHIVCYNIDKDEPYYEPYIIIIDDFDCIMHDEQLANKLLYIAERGQRIGIYLILASNQVNYNVFTGRLKANFPARISFYQPTDVKSRIILDGTCAHYLTQHNEFYYSYDSAVTKLQIPKTGEDYEYYFL
mgnify:CR=1 FL=1